MKVLILRSIIFEDELEHLLIDSLIKEYKKRGHEVAIYNMPASDNVQHWSGYSIVDYNVWSDVLICIDFPTALIQHRNKRIILTKDLSSNEELQIAIKTAIDEASDCYRVSTVQYNCDIFPDNLNEYI